jgi:hypothetical protein
MGKDEASRGDFLRIKYHDKKLFHKKPLRCFLLVIYLSLFSPYPLKSTGSDRTRQDPDLPGNRIIP